jgi:hypothetical protein
LSKLIGGGADGGKVTLFANMDDAITTGNIFEIKDGSTGSLFLGLSHAGILTAGGGTSTQWNTAYTYSQVGHLPLTGGTLSGALTSGRLTLTNNVSTGGFGSFNDYQILLYKDTTADSSYGVGIEGGTFMFHSNDQYKFYVNNAVKATINGSGNLTLTGTITASGYNKTNWDTAYGWGNHAGLYLPLAGKAADSELLDGLNSTAFIRNSGYANQTEYSILDNGSINGPVIKIRYDSATVNRWWDIGYKDGNGTYYEGLKGYNNSTLTWLGQTIIHSGNIGSQSVANASTLDSLDSTQFLRSDESDTMTGSLTINASGVGLNVSSSQNTGLIVDGGTNSGIIAEFKNGSTKAVINTSGGGYFLGSVGIGVTSPSEKLHVVGDVLIANTSNGAWLKGYDNHHSIYFREGNANQINYYEYGGTLADNTGHRFFTGTLKESQLLRMQIANDGIYASVPMGIGTSSPTYRLDVYQNADVWHASFGSATGELRIGGQTSNGAVIQAYVPGTTTTRDLYLQRDGGNVGIGTFNPGDKLHVYSSSYDANIRLTDAAVANADWSLLPSSGGSTAIFRLYNRSTAVVNQTWTPNGDVGIGTTSPAYKLDVNGTARVSGDFIVSGSSNSSWMGAIDNQGTTNANGLYVNIGASSTGKPFAVYKNFSQLFGVENSGAATFSSSVTTGGNIITPYKAFYTNTYAIGSPYTFTQVNYGGGAYCGIKFNAHNPQNGLSSALEIQTMNNSGNYNTTLYLDGINNRVGIGTTSPEAKLHVVGYGKITSGLNIGTGSAPAELTGINVAMNGNSYILASNNTISTFMGADTSGYGMIGTLTNHALAIRTNNNVRAYITQSGDVGIGTTSPTEKLDVRGILRISRDGVNDSGILAFGNYLNGSGYFDNGIFRSALNQPLVAGNTLHIASYEALAFTSGAAAFGSQSIRMYISGSTGHIGIGLTSLDTRFAVYQDGDVWHAKIGNDNGQVRVGGYTEDGAVIQSRNQGGTARKLFLNRDGGNVSINANTASYPLDVAGTIRATGDVLAYSDARVKENVETIDNALDKVMSMRGVSYNRTDSNDKTKKVGVIAQEIQKVLPEVVSEQEDGMLSVSYGNIVGVLIEAIKELKNEVNELKAIINGVTK